MASWDQGEFSSGRRGERASALDPKFTLAYDGASRTYLRQVPSWGTPLYGGRPFWY